MKKKKTNENEYNFLILYAFFIYFPLFPFFMFHLFSSHFHFHFLIFSFLGSEIGLDSFGFYGSKNLTPVDNRKKNNTNPNANHLG